MQINLQTPISALKGQSFVLLQDGSVKLNGTNADLYISPEIFAMLKAEFAKAEAKRNLGQFVVNRRVKTVNGKEFTRFEVRLGMTL